MREIVCCTRACALLSYVPSFTRLGIGAMAPKKTVTSDVGERVLNQIKKKKRKVEEDLETPHSENHEDIDIPDDSKTALVHKRATKASPLDLVLVWKQAKH